MKRYGLFVILLLLIGIGGLSFLEAQQKPQFHQLKSYMYNYQTLVADLGMMKRDKSTDWKLVDQKVRELQYNLREMKKFHEGAYQSSLDSLNASMNRLLYLEKKRDRQFFDQLENIKQDCFQCHSTHNVLGIRGRYDL